VIDPFLLEVVINGILLGGVLALLALGLNLIYGVIDVVWICYADLIMIGMYIIFWLHAFYALPLIPAMGVAILGVALSGFILHFLVIQPVLGMAPINQLLATGGVLFFLQSIATLLFGVEFRNLGLRLPIIQLGDLFISYARLLAFITALVAMIGMYLFLRLSYLGIAIRAIAQDREIIPLMGASPRRLYLIASAIGGGLAGLAACLLILQYDVHPHVGITFGPIAFMIVVLGGLGNMLGGFIAAFIIAQFISVGGFYLTTEWGYVLAFTFFIVMMFIRPRGLLQGN
jgi:branched-chain amino acid transport system permease protein